MYDQTELETVIVVRIDCYNIIKYYKLYKEKYAYCRFLHEIVKVLALKTC